MRLGLSHLSVIHPPRRLTLLPSLGVAVALAFGLVACTKKPIEFAGRPCALGNVCTKGYLCNPSTKLCEQEIDVSPSCIPGVAGCAMVYLDFDHDGFGAGASRCMCDVATTPGYSTRGDDCDDDSATSYPGAVEVCDGRDNDCDGSIDEPPAGGCTIYFRDEDGDGYGVTGDSRCLCAADRVYRSTQSGDCDDTVGSGAALHPGATEICNLIDDDCNGLIDDADPGVQGRGIYFYDLDRDGHGRSGTDTPLCASDPIGFYDATVGDDCDDTLAGCGAACHPGLAEICDAFDNDCNGIINDASGCGFSFQIMTQVSGLPSDIITALALGPDGTTLWVGTSALAGAVTLNSGTGVMTAVPGLESKPTSSIAVNTAMGAWVGYDEPGCDTDNGGGTLECGPTHVGVGRYFTDGLAGANNGVNALALSTSRAYMGTDAHVARAPIASWCDYNTGAWPVRSLAVTAAPARLWAATDEGLYSCTATCGACAGWDIFAPVPVAAGSNDDLTALAWTTAPSTDLVFVGSKTYGLTMVQFATAATTPSIIGTGPLLTDDVRALAFDAVRSTLLAGTRGKGLALIGPPLDTAPTYLWYSTGEGLPSPNVTAIVVQQPNIVWIGTDMGLVKAIYQP